MRRAAALALATALPFAAAAQDRPNTMLVLDGSGSMWGQIEGVNKIVIAREVLGTILDDFPADENLGLTVYGHRERGNCADIETVVPSGPGTVEAIREAAGAINPRGKTPMTDAIVSAAEALRYTEERATVVLVSDGIETCNPDPCAAARALEQAGIDFTAHVVGFDVTDPEALAQMQCLADETGGTFTTASNAAELTSALQQVTVAESEPEPEPVPVTITFQARLDAEDGPPVDGPVFWTVTELEGERDGNPLELPMTTGSYEVEAYWAAGEVAQSRQFVVGETPREIVLVFETPAPTATLTAPATAVGGSTVEVGWNGPEAEGDFIGIRPPNDPDGYHRFANTTALDEGNPLPLLMPVPEGEWIIEYVSGSDRAAIAEATITLSPPQATITAPATAPASATVEIGWTGPEYEYDFIGVRDPENDGYHRFVNTAKLDDAPADLLMPAEPGEYVVEYIAGQNRSPLAAAMVTVEAVTATVTAPAMAQAGAEIEVGWTGPAYDGDFIGIRAPDDDSYHRFIDTAKLDGAQVTILVPGVPGDYVIEYVEGQARAPLAATLITAEAVTATLTAPATAAAGATVEIGWTGPAYDDDFVAVRAPDADGYHRFVNTAKLDGSPVALLMPAEPGDYVVEYILGQERAPLAAAAVTVEAVGASVAAPQTAVAGSTVEVGWSGPAYRNDFIGVRAPDATGYHRFVNTAKVASGGEPVDLLLPADAGTFVIEYIVAQDREPIAAVEIVLTAPEAGITAPASADAGDTVEIGWIGPAHKNDFVAVRRPDATGYHRFVNTSKVASDGAPVNLLMPSVPGTYVVEYIVNQDREPIAGAEITVAAVEATLAAPATATAGSEIEIAWTGPGYRNDFVAIRKPEAEGYHRFSTSARTRGGEVLRLDVPEEPGSYVVEYIEGQDRTPLVSVPLEVTAQ